MQLDPQSLVCQLRLNELGGAKDENTGVLESVLKTVGKVTDQAGFTENPPEVIFKKLFAFCAAL